MAVPFTKQFDAGSKKLSSFSFRLIRVNCVPPLVKIQLEREVNIGLAPMRTLFDAVEFSIQNSNILSHVTR